MPVEAGGPTEGAMAELTALWAAIRRDGVINPLVAMAGFVLNFLCIHPFRDGNGRASRLLTLLLSYHAGAEVGRYISLERQIEQNKLRYYETLKQSSQGWHEGKHNPLPFVNYTLWILKVAYKESSSASGTRPNRSGRRPKWFVRQSTASKEASVSRIWSAPVRELDAIGFGTSFVK